MNTSRALALLCLASVWGCGGSTTATRTVQSKSHGSSHTRNGGEPASSSQPDVLFDEANAHLRAHECTEAVALYDRLGRRIRLLPIRSPASTTAPMSQRRRAWEHSVARYERLPAMRPTHRRKHAMLQMADGLEHLERWQMHRNAEAALRRADLTSAERWKPSPAAPRSPRPRPPRRSRTPSPRGQLVFPHAKGEEVIHDEYFAAIATYVLAETIPSAPKLTLQTATSSPTRRPRQRAQFSSSAKTPTRAIRRRTRIGPPLGYRSARVRSFWSTPSPPPPSTSTRANERSTTRPLPRNYRSSFEIASAHSAPAIRYWN